MDIGINEKLELVVILTGGRLPPLQYRRELRS